MRLTISPLLAIKTFLIKRNPFSKKEYYVYIYTEKQEFMQVFLHKNTEIF